MINTLEILELKLAQTRLESADKLDRYEIEYKEKYSGFFDMLFKNHNLWVERFISVNFGLEKLDHPEKSDIEIFQKSLKKSFDILPINIDKKIQLENIVINLNNKKSNISEIFLDNSDLHKDKDFPIIESLKKYQILDNHDLLKISLKFKETKNFLESISVLEKTKKDIIKSHYFELNNTKSEDRINNFKNDFSEEIKISQNIQIYPNILNFIWKNYFKLRLKNKIESKKDRLIRMFKIAFLKLYRLKYSGIDITEILNKIDSLEDLDSMINLLLKFFEQLKENPVLQKDYIISYEIEKVEEIWVEAEENKEKLLFFEEKIIKVSSIIEKWEKLITWNDLDELLSSEVDLIWNEFVKRDSSDLISPKRREIATNILYKDNEDEDEEELEKEVDLEEYYQELKNNLDEIEKKKSKLFLDWNYDLLDEINDEILELIIKLEKVSKLMWFS